MTDCTKPRWQGPACGMVLVTFVVFVAADDPKREAVDDTTSAAVNQRIAAYARSQLGKKVGDGECTTLVVEAYCEAGADGIPRAEDGEDYVWGTLVEKRADIRPGDILQFQDAVFAGTRRTRRGGRVMINTYRRTLEHHTAIVEETRDRGRRLVVLHQNAGAPDAPDEVRRIVQRETFLMGDLQRGTVKAYRPVPEGGAGENPSQHEGTESTQ